LNTFCLIRCLVDKTLLYILDNYVNDKKLSCDLVRSINFQFVYSNLSILNNNFKIKHDITVITLSLVIANVVLIIKSKSFNFYRTIMKLYVVTDFNGRESSSPLLTLAVTTFFFFLIYWRLEIGGLGSILAKNYPSKLFFLLF
jgi:hypothetical protein